MKKLIYLASILLAGVMITMYSCTKRNEVSKNDQCTTCQDGRLLAEKINHFKAQLLRAKDNPKDGEVMTMEDARENLELLFNATYGFPTEEYTKIQVDTVEFDVPVNADGNILMTDVLIKYDQMHNLVKGVYDNINFTEKHLVSLSLIFYEDESGATKAKAVSTIGEKGSKNMGHFNNCWWYGKNKGMCNGNFFGKLDGGDTLANELFAYRPFPLYCPEGHHGLIVQDYDNSFAGEPGSWGDGYIFYLSKEYGTPFTTSEEQLSASEMNYWYDHEYDFLFNVLPATLNKPNNWILTSLSIYGDEHFDNSYYYHWINHINNVKYGLFYCVKDNIIEPPIDLID